MDHSKLETLETLKTSSDCDEIRDVLPNLIRSFEREEDTSILPEVISSIFGHAAQALPMQDLEHAILHPFLPRVKYFISKTLSAIHTLLEFEIHEESLIAEITRHIQICVQVLTDIDNLLSYIVNLNHVSASSIFSVPRNIADIVYEVFTHCQKSKADYKTTFTAVRRELMSLFQNCHKVQVNLFTLLNEKLVFNCNIEKELMLLADILDTLFLMAEAVADLDTMSLVAHWKGYAQLTQTYADYLCSVLEVARPISYLAVNISHQLSNVKLYISSEQKIVFRSLKITSLQLKVLIKLCDQFKGYLGDCHEELLNCLLSLCVGTSQYLRSQGVDNDTAAQITTHFSAGAAPLLTHLISDALFVKNYLEYADKLHSSPFVTQVGYCHLTNMILKKMIQLCSQDHEIQELWLRPTLPLVETVFKLLYECSTDGGLFMMYEDDIYKSLLIHTAAFVVTTCSCDTFPYLEKLLIKHLLQPLLWPSCFSSDLLCLIARFGSSELCLQLTCLLSDLLSCWPTWDWHRPEWVYVSWTQGRLIQFLSSNDLQNFPSRFPSICSDITNVLNKPFSDEKDVLFQSLIEKLALFGDNMGLIPGSNLNQLYQLWQYVTVNAEAEFAETSNWFIGFYSFVTMATCSVMSSLTNNHIGHILDVLMKASSLNTTFFHCAACEFLRSLANITLNSDSSEATVCQRMSSLFVKLMQNENPVLKQVALETFSFFAYVTKYEQIVADTVVTDLQLQNEITNYLEGVTNAHSDTSIVKHIKFLHQKFVHKCKVKNKLKIPEFENSESNPSKKLKLSNNESVSVVLQRMEKDIDLIETYNRSTTISDSHISALQTIYMRLGKVIKT